MISVPHSSEGQAVNPAQAAFLPVYAQAGVGTGVRQGAGQCCWLLWQQSSHTLCVQGARVDVGEAPSAEILVWFSLRSMCLVIAELV